MQIGRIEKNPKHDLADQSHKRSDKLWILKKLPASEQVVDPGLLAKHNI